jgi:hypothetical protein
LAGTSLTDEGLRQLRDLPRLRRLFIGGSLVTAAGADDFHSAKPAVEPQWWPALAVSEEPAERKAQ